MSPIDIIYDLSPVIIQNVLCSVKGFLINRKRFNQNFRKELAAFENGQYKQEIKLCNFLYNIRNIPYYKQLYLQYSFNVAAVDIYKELSKLPLLTKQQIKSDYTRFVNTAYKGETYTLHTSGTTGSGMVFPCSREMENKQWAVWWRYRRWHGIEFNTWCGWFGGRTIISSKNRKPPFWRINYLGKQVMFSAYHLNAETASLYYRKIEAVKLTWLHGYPSQISFLSSLILDLKLPPLEHVSHITFGAENLFDNQVQLIKKAFPNAHLAQHYGLSEGVANLSLDVNGNWVIDDDFAYVEFIPVSEEEPDICRIIGTGFSNEAFPLVRYDTGDIAHIERQKDGTVKVLSIDGRKEDFILLPNGVNLGRLDHIFKDMVNIQEAQIHQKEISKIEFKIVRGKQYTTKDEQLLWNEIRKRIDETVDVKFVYVDKIPRTKSGKLRLVISELK